MNNTDEGLKYFTFEPDCVRIHIKKATIWSHEIENFLNPRTCFCSYTFKESG